MLGITSWQSLKMEREVGFRLFLHIEPEGCFQPSWLLFILNFPRCIKVSEQLSAGKSTYFMISPSKGTGGLLVKVWGGLLNSVHKDEDSCMFVTKSYMFGFEDLLSGRGSVFPYLHQGQRLEPQKQG